MSRLKRPRRQTRPFYSPARLSASIATAAATAAAAAAATSTEAATAAGRLRTRLIHCQVAAAKLRIVQLVDRVLRVFLRHHLDERKSARPPGGHVANDVHRFDLSDTAEQIVQLLFARREGEVADVEFSSHLILTSAPCRGGSRR